MYMYSVILCKKASPFGRSSTQIFQIQNEYTKYTEVMHANTWILIRALFCEDMLPEQNIMKNWIWPEEKRILFSSPSVG